MIVWKDGTVGKGVVGTFSKITPKEWRIYTKKILESVTDKARDKMKLRIRETLGKIKKNGGFQSI